MIKRQVFFSFRYDYDNWRASQIRNMGKVSDESTFSDNDWEEVKFKSDTAIQNWIDKEMKMRSCLVLLIGEHTNNRKWIDYEIEHAWKEGKGIVAIHIHKLKDKNSLQCSMGHNPLEDFYVDRTINYINKRTRPLDSNDVNLSKVCKTYNPPYSISTNVYNYIKEHMEEWIEEAISIRNTFPK